MGEGVDQPREENQSEERDRPKDKPGNRHPKGGVFVHVGPFDANDNGENGREGDDKELKDVP